MGRVVGDGFSSGPISTLENTMPRKPSSYTKAEIALAKQMFAKAEASGTLKPGRGLIAIALSSGYRRSVAQTTTYRDYLRDARLNLARQVGPEQARRRRD